MSHPQQTIATPAAASPETKEGPKLSAYETALKAESKAVKAVAKVFATLDHSARARLVAHVVEVYGAK